MTHSFDYAEAFSRNIGWVTETEQYLLRSKRVAIAGMGGEVLPIRPLSLGSTERTCLIFRNKAWPVVERGDSEFPGGVRPSTWTILPSFPALHVREN